MINLHSLSDGIIRSYFRCVICYYRIASKRAFIIFLDVHIFCFMLAIHMPFSWYVMLAKCGGVVVYAFTCMRASLYGCRALASHA